MSFWTGIIIGFLFAWHLVKTGFFESWMILFNLVISIYLAITLQPLLAEAVPITAKSSYHTAFAMLATATVSFLILYGILYLFFTSQFSATFPGPLDIFGSAILGFLAGFLVWSFAGFLFCLTPFSKSTIVKGVDFVSEVEQCNVPYVCWWYNIVNSVVAKSQDTTNCKLKIGKLLKEAQARPISRFRKIEPDDDAGSTEPNKPSDENEFDTTTPGSRLGITPDITAVP